MGRRPWFKCERGLRTGENVGMLFRSSFFVIVLHINGIAADLEEECGMEVQHRTGLQILRRTLTRDAFPL
jgi:hypothetical protein